MLSLVTEAVQGNVPQEQGQDSHHAWHSRNPPSPSHPGGCQWCRCPPNRTAQETEIIPRPNTWNAGFFSLFSADLQVRFLQDAGPPDLPALHPSRPALPLRWGHHQWRKQLLLTHLVWQNNSSKTCALGLRLGFPHFLSIL